MNFHILEHFIQTHIALTDIYGIWIQGIVMKTGFIIQ